MMKKYLYGLNQSPKIWYQNFDTYILGPNFTRSKVKDSLYFKLVNNHLIYLVLYVEDILLFINDKEIIQEMKMEFSFKFGMKDINVANFILGMEIRRNWENMKIWLNYRKHVEKIV